MDLIRATALLSVCLAYIQLDVWKDQAPSLIKRFADEGARLQNMISFYQVELKIGNPPQQVSVQVDTGSSDLWVTSSNNPYCKEIECRKEFTFDKARSSSLKTNHTSPPFAISYGDSTFASGIYVQDTVEIGNGHAGNGHLTRKSDFQQRHKGASESFVIRDANFAIAEQANSSEAVWGLGLMYSESLVHNVNEYGEPFPTYANLPVQMKQQGYIDNIAYSLWLNDLYASTGSLLFGAVDHARYVDELQKVPLICAYPGISEPIDFSIMLHGISVYNEANETASLFDCSIPVLLDSGTTYIQLPTEMLNSIAASLGAIYDNNQDVYLVNETQKRRLRGGGLSFNLSGIKITVPVEELLLPLGSINDIINARQKHKKTGKRRTEADIDSTPNVILKEGSHPAVKKRSVENYRQVGNKKQGATELESRITETGMDGSNEKLYLLGILPIEPGSNEIYILGDTFLRSAYVVYDLESKEIALANTRHNAADSQIEKIDSNGIPRAQQAAQYSSTNISPEVAIYNASDIFLDGCDEATDRAMKVTCRAVNVKSNESSSIATIGGIVSRTALPFAGTSPGARANSSASRNTSSGHRTKNGALRTSMHSDVTLLSMLGMATAICLSQ